MATAPTLFWGMKPEKIEKTLALAANGMQKAKTTKISLRQKGLPRKIFKNWLNLLPELCSFVNISLSLNDNQQRRNGST